MVRPEADGRQPVLQGPCRLGDRVLEVLVVEGQDQVVAVGHPGPPQACGHLAGVADDPVHEQGDRLAFATRARTASGSGS